MAGPPRPVDAVTVRGLISIASAHKLGNTMKRHPNIAFFGGTVVIALMVLAAFSNMAVAGTCARSGESQAQRAEQLDQQRNSEAETDV